MIRTHHALHPLLLGLCVLFSSAGCKKEQLEQLTQQVKQATVEKIEAVAAAPAATGQFRLKVDTDIQTDMGQATLLKLGDGRSILQLRSYPKDAESFPAILFEAISPVSELNPLVGQSLAGQLYIQPGAQSPIWYSQDNQPISLTVNAIEKNELVITFATGTLMSTEGKSASFTGQCRGAFLTSDTPTGVSQ